jgi:hypothetical protein
MPSSKRRSFSPNINWHFYGNYCVPRFLALCKGDFSVLKRSLEVGTERRAIVTRSSAAQRATSGTGARPMSAYLISGALGRFLGFARFLAIVASEASTPARSKSSS